MGIKNLILVKLENYEELKCLKHHQSFFPSDIHNLFAKLSSIPGIST